MFPFPEHAYLGQLHITDSALYRYNGLTWDRVRIGMSSTPTATPTPTPQPTTPGEISLQALEARISEIEAALQTGLLLLE